MTTAASALHNSGLFESLAKNYEAHANRLRDTADSSTEDKRLVLIYEKVWHAKLEGLLHAAIQELDAEAETPGRSEADDLVGQRETQETKEST